MARHHMQEPNELPYYSRILNPDSSYGYSLCNQFVVCEAIKKTKGPKNNHTVGPLIKDLLRMQKPPLPIKGKHP